MAAGTANKLFMGAAGAGALGMGAWWLAPHSAPESARSEPTVETAASTVPKTVAQTAGLSGQSRSAPEIYSRLGPAVGRIEFDGELYSGEREQGTGSGFLISPDGLMLTCKHVVPVPTNYKSINLSVRLGSRGSDQVPAQIVWTAPDMDLVVLKLASGGVSIPLNAEAAAPGNDVVVLGFPVDLDLNISKGIVSGIVDPRRYVMDAVINPGNSGGPVIDYHGDAVGVAWGGALKWKVGEETVPIEGVKFFIPMSAVIAALPDHIREQTRVGNAWSDKANVPPPPRISRAVTVEFMKDDHPVFLAPHRRWYKQRIDAEAGYRIEKLSKTEQSRNNAPNFNVVVSPDGTFATVRVQLESGPTVDRWRGWLMATVQLEQVRR